jgi:prepilin-type N-terminal cleavage/methylation domain-containing protein
MPSRNSTALAFRRTHSRRSRTGFTLWEIATVLLIMAIAATVAAPAFVSLGKEPAHGVTAALLDLLSDTRAMSIERAVESTLLIDPVNGHYRLDTTSTFGTGTVIEDSLRLGAIERLETDLPRLRYVFRPTGAAFADSVVVLGGDSTRLIIVDPWSGVAHAIAR